MVTKVKVNGNGKVGEEEFVLRAIERLRKPGSQGIHSVFSGFNQAFRSYYEGADPVAATTRLAKEGKIESRPVRGGVMLYKPGEGPTARDAGQDALTKMGL